MRIAVFTGLIASIVVIAVLAAHRTPREGEAAFPGENGLIVFSSEATEAHELYTMEADGSNIDQLTFAGPDASYDPQWSPDGEEIVFTREYLGPAGMANPIDIYKITKEGVETPLTSNALQNNHASWSPDGEKIVFASNRDGNFEIYVMRADGSEPERLTNNEDFDSYPRWSPDGDTILFSTTRDGNFEIYSMNPDGSDQTNLTNHPALDFYSDWSPDGLGFVFASERNAGRNIWKANADGSGPTQLTVEGGNTPNYSPDGSKALFESERDGDREVFVMDADGSNEIPLTENIWIDSGGVFQPLAIETTKGDNDCDGDIDATDALKALQEVAGLPYEQEQPCPQLASGDPVFGDIDCDGDVDAVDALFILQFVAALPVNLPQGCPPIGAA